MIKGEKAGFSDWHAALVEQSADPIPDQSLGVPMLYSSGTTGKPKGVFRAPENIDLDAPHPLKLAGAYYGFNADTVYLSPAPLYHAAPFSVYLMHM